MRLDLVKPCKNCPFGNSPDRIRFRTRERAEEIAEGAYRNGFPCHLSAELVDEEDDPIGGGGFYPGDNTQHCVGAILMFLADDTGTWPGVGNEEFSEEYWDRITPALRDRLAFQSEEEFINANS